MVNVNFSKAKCPTCGKKVSLRVISKYFWHGTSYYTECNHCGQRIHPAKEPVSMFKCWNVGLASDVFLLESGCVGFLASSFMCHSFYTANIINKLHPHSA